MKSRVEWDQSDIKSGMYVCRESYPEDCDDISGLCSVTYKVGYINYKIDAMATISINDGAVFIHKKNNGETRKEAMARYFNDDREGYRPLTQKEIMRRMKYLKRMHNYWQDGG